MDKRATLGLIIIILAALLIGTSPAHSTEVEQSKGIRTSEEVEASLQALAKDYFHKTAPQQRFFVSSHYRRDLRQGWLMNYVPDRPEHAEGSTGEEGAIVLDSAIYGIFITEEGLAHIFRWGGHGMWSEIVGPLRTEAGLQQSIRRAVKKHGGRELDDIPSREDMKHSVLVYTPRLDTSPDGETLMLFYDSNHILRGVHESTKPRPSGRASDN